MTEFVPKLVSTLRGYDRRQLRGDVGAGIVVAVVALPLAIAFAIASGVSPERGLYTAIVAGFLISALGGSRVQIGGPTGAFVVIVYGVVQQYGLEGLTLATIMAGVMLIAMGVARMGTLIKFIPQSLVIGFTSGIAVVIALSQARDALGLQVDSLPAEFAAKLATLGAALPSVNLWALGVTAGSLGLLALWPRVNRAIPAPLVVIVLATLAVHSLDLPVATIGSRFGELKGSIPEPILPRVTFADATRLVSPAFAIALLGAVESLLSAVVADGMIGSRHRSNAELVAQGIANIVSPIFGGIPATGAIARTATNVKSGGRTPVAGITHAVVLLLITLLFGRWASLIPLPALAAILLMVSYHMSEWRSFIDEVRGPRADAAVLVTTFLLTVVVDLTLAIEVGMVLAAFLFMHRMAQVTNVTAITRELTESDGADEPSMLEDRAAIPSGVEVFEIRGAFFFGAAETFKDTIREVSRRPKVLIIRMRDVSLLDGTGLRVLRDLARRSKGEGTHLLLAELHAQPLVIIERSPLQAELGPSAIHMTLEDAVDHAVVLMGPTKPAIAENAGRRA